MKAKATPATTVADWDNPVTFVTLTSGRMFQTSSRMFQTSGRMIQTSGRIFQTSDRTFQTSGRIIQTSGRMIQTSGRMFQKSGLENYYQLQLWVTILWQLFRMFFGLLGIPYLRGTLLRASTCKEKSLHSKEKD